METLLLFLCVFLLLLIVGILVYIGAFLVQFRNRVNGLFSDLIQALEIMHGAIPLVKETEKEPKTWDEKYEIELEEIRRKKYQDSGLKDINDQNLSWGVPPALNPQKAEGLIIKDK